MYFLPERQYIKLQLHRTGDNGIITIHFDLIFSLKGRATTTLTNPHQDRPVEVKLENRNFDFLQLLKVQIHL